MHIALAVTGCVAAYKAVEVLRGLQKRGHTVQVVMTRHATEFIRPLQFQSVSGLPVITDMFAQSEDPEIKHIQIAQAIDVLLVAPATANTLAKFALGLADDFLSTLYISTTAPVMVAPAMNVEMWMHPATQKNVRALKERGVQFVDPGEGYLACRTVGAGRLAEPLDIVERVVGLFAQGRVIQPDGDLSSTHIIITAGPTYEAIDPVRGITNRSSGKMGFALALAARSRGARVTLVSGPVQLEPPPGVDYIAVRSAQEMLDSVQRSMEPDSVLIMAAAVADYRPASVSQKKIKKNGEGLTLELIPTVDVLATVAGSKASNFIVGFAAETEELHANARKKLEEKGADLIVANDVTVRGAGFDADTNRVSIISRSESIDLPLMEKSAVANRILDAIVKNRSKSSGGTR